MAESSPPTLINLPPSDPATPSDAPGTPNSTTTSMSELSTVAIKDGHRGHLPHSHHSRAPTSGTLDAERADRISRLAGLERVTTARNPTPISNLTPGAAAPHSGPAAGYFDSQGVPLLGRERSTVGSASATGSVGGRTTTWASGSDVFDHDKMSESQDMDMDTSSVGAASETNSLVGFGEGARTPARHSTVGSPSVAKATPTASALSQSFQRDSSLTPVSSHAQSEQQDVQMIDRRTLDTGTETAERIMRERLGPEGGQRGLESPDPSSGPGRDLGKFYFESGK
ncbi:hypothetical protein M436DRAFT_76462 [Aureobasidium namibiae CBS 147.97]|uniref:Uncharacterized protein n=1 Tax=Aureobasidium namibiae CBS 147.97 TaxID=1043004 RepID=A0A074W8J8_9PEZI|nr:uncharacterized protein M436DRAFT_76462 [Aureobasidium namibiae CBS 147.97]KEQ69193.1 hypothetical protein M436DRAFT_76462 [Aureobasidium namibiae CBS 147.97]